jgi:hypothetical protein
MWKFRVCMNPPPVANFSVGSCWDCWGSFACQKKKHMYSIFNLSPVPHLQVLTLRVSTRNTWWETWSCESDLGLSENTAPQNLALKHHVFHSIFRTHPSASIPQLTNLECWGATKDTAKLRKACFRCWICSESPLESCPALWPTQSIWIYAHARNIWRTKMGFLTTRTKYVFSLYWLVENVVPCSHSGP